MGPRDQFQFKAVAEEQRKDANCVLTDGPAPVPMTAPEAIARTTVPRIANKGAAAVIALNSSDHEPRPITKACETWDRWYRCLFEVPRALLAVAPFAVSTVEAVTVCESVSTVRTRIV